MILDTIDNIKRYQNISENILKAIAFIQNNNLNSLSIGKHAIHGDDVFVIINEYETKPQAECFIETHKKYIDIQIMLSGEENMGFAFLKNQEIITPYSNENDCIFYKADINIEKLRAGEFAIFFPTDLHSPGIMVEKPMNVRKAVVKVSV